MNSRTIFEVSCAAVGGAMGFLFGAADGMFYALIAFIVLDYITGIIEAIMKKRLSSRIGFDGICKKAILFIIVALANIIDVQIMGNTGGLLRSATISLFLANEGLSILENAANAGLPVPRVIIKVLEQFKKEN